MCNDRPRGLRTGPSGAALTVKQAAAFLVGVISATTPVFAQTPSQDVPPPSPGVGEDRLMPAATANAPLSAIDWLSKSVAMPIAQPPRSPGAGDVATEVTPPRINTTPLGAPDADATGILPPSVTGLPQGFWGSTPTADLMRLIETAHVDALPALQDLLYTLLLAELDPPFDATGTGQLFLARVDKLLSLGGLDQARALLDVAGTDTPPTFRRWFDIALLMGDEDRACVTLDSRPGIAPTFPARVFCLARGGDWPAAALSLRTGEALGYVTGPEAELMTRFLDPVLFEGEPVIAPPGPMTPLTWRLLEAIGEPVPTTTLPVAFAHADLRSNVGWKARIEAAERLARLGAVPGNLLWGLYAEGRPSASGGVWDRVSAAQTLDRALVLGNAREVDASLRNIWPLMQAAGLEVPFAELYGARLQNAGLEGDSAQLAFHIGLLSADYEEVAAQTAPADGQDAFLTGIARGDATGLTPPNAMGRAILDGLTTEGPPPALADLVSSGRLGEAVLRAMDTLGRGLAGDTAAITEGLALLRHIGLEDTVRRTALQLMLLDRRG